MLKLTVYLDTSSWNHLLNGPLPLLDEVIGKASLCIPCYSTQSIEELFGLRDEAKRAALDMQLDAVGARCLETISDVEGGMPTGYTITVKDPEQRQEIHNAMQKFASVGGFGLGDLLQKMIGGIPSTDHEDIIEKAKDDIEQLLNIDFSGLPPELEAALKKASEDMKHKAHKAQNDLFEQLNRQNDIRLQKLDPSRINNFTGAGAVERIFDSARSQEGSSYLVEEFLNQSPCIPAKRGEAHLGTPSWEQVSLLAQLLFLLGYWRETKYRKDTARARLDFSGGQADICHIANAFFCSIFYTSDKPQAHLAAAVYDHLSVPTAVILYSPVTNTESIVYMPTNLQAIEE